MTKSSYHHGDLRRALLAAAAAAIEETGVAKLSLRDLARRAGVSHAAPQHHFGDKAGLLTALAVEGFQRLGVVLTAADSFLEGGVAYVRFAVENRAHFEVMFRPELYHASDPAVVEARSVAGDALNAGAFSDAAPDVAADPDAVREVGLAGWSMAHGFAMLWLSGALPGMGATAASTDSDSVFVEAAARSVLRRLNSQ